MASNEFNDMQDVQVVVPQVFEPSDVLVGSNEFKEPHTTLRRVDGTGAGSTCRKGSSKGCVVRSYAP